jgi:hypothetical protein
MTQVIDILATLDDHQLNTVSDDDLIHMMDQSLIKILQFLNQHNNK